MKVGELLARLMTADPEDIVVIDSDSQCLWLCNTRPRLLQPLEEDGDAFTECDKEFLRAMRVRL